MVKYHPRIDRLIKKFWHKVNIEMNIAELQDCFEYPGGIVVVSRKMASKGAENASAYTKRVKKIDEQGKPIFKIYLIKEEVERMSDKQFLNALAHEMSHVLIKLNQLEEYVCDVLAEAFFGYPKPKGSTDGYLFKEKELERV